MTDYFSYPNAPVTKTKDCEYCRAKGYYLLTYIFNGLKLPRYTSCEYCKGLGYIAINND